MLIYLICLIANIILKFGFELTQKNYFPTIWIVFEVMPCWLFIMQVFLDINTAYYSKGNFVSNRRKIFNHYVKYCLIFDILTIMPFFVNQTLAGIYLEILVVFRLKNVETLLKRLEEYLQLKGKKEGLFQLIKLIISLLFLAHISACAWHYIGLWEKKLGVDNNWLAVKGIESQKWYIRYNYDIYLSFKMVFLIRYIYSFYFSIVTMMTVGYGDITPSNYIECSFLIFIIIYGCGVFAYSINNIGNIFKEMYQEDKEFKSMIFFKYHIL